MPHTFTNIEIRSFVGNKNIETNISKIPANNSTMCGQFCTGFNGFMLAGKTLIDYASLFSPYDFKENEKIILNYIKNQYKNYFC